MGEGKSLAQLYFEEYARHCPTTGGKRYLPEWPELSSHVRTCWIRRAGVRLSKRARESYAEEYAAQLHDGKLPPWQFQSEAFRVRWIDGVRKTLVSELTAPASD